MIVKIIHLGGTFSMVRDNGYFRVEAGTLVKNLQNCKELNHGSEKSHFYQKNNRRLDYTIYEYSVKDSSELKLSDCIDLSLHIKTDYMNYDGFIVICGTDTMSYISSALSFLIENLDKPIIFTGSMVPFIEPNSDAISNLKGTFESFFNNLVPNVYIYFSNALMQANRTTKIDSSKFAAYATKFAIPLKANGPLKFYNDLNSNVALVKLYPEMKLEVLENILKSHKGVVLESYGAGNVPKYLLDTLKIYSEKKIIINISQCVYGIASTSYENGSFLSTDTMVFCGEDMTVEAAMMKLCFLLANYDGQEARKLVCKSIRGELSN